jgi:hypothetical protein
MLPRHIQEREDRKTLDLLGFALGRSGIDKSAWQVAAWFEALAPCDDCVCLYSADGGLIVAYAERGQWREMARFPESHEASKYFFANFRPGPSPYDMRQAWETETGQAFSMVD